MKKIYICLLAIVTLVSASCSDYLDRLPTDKPSSENFLQSKTELDLALNAAYRVFYYMSSGSSTYLALDGTTDNARVRAAGFFDGMETISMGSHTPNTSLFSSTWNHFYRYIARCNYILDNMNKANDATESDLEIIRAQVLFMRAYCYGELISFFGDVPYMEHMVTEVEKARIPRTPKDEILSHIFSDLDEAITSLPSKWNKDNTGKITKWAAYTYKARLALRFAKYADAIQASKTVIDNHVEAGLDLYENYENLFNIHGIRNKEVILDVPFHEKVMYTSSLNLNPRCSRGWAILQPTHSLVDSYECIDGKPIDESPLFDQANPYANRDPRLSASIIHDGGWYKGVRYETHPDSLLASKVVGGVEMRIQNQEVTNAYASHTGYLWRKYADFSVDDVNKSTLNFILMRYAEVLMTYAEAKLEVGQIDESVYDALNQIRRRVGMPDIREKDPDKLRSLIRNERKVEFALEGFRLFDIRRWKIAEHVMPGTLPGRLIKERWFNPGVPTIDQYGIARYKDQETIFAPVHKRIFDPTRDYLWPIPQKEIDVNKQLVQNPNY